MYHPLFHIRSKLVSLIVLIIIDTIAIQGRAAIEKSRLTQLAQIETNKQTALKQLSVKYASADKAKKSFGYIGIISLCSLWGVIILNDLVKLVRLLYFILKDYSKEDSKRRRVNMNQQNDQIKIELDKIYSEQLEDNLEKFYIKLIKAKANRNN